MTTKSALDALDKAATQGEWEYRPNEYDDWGVVKSAPLPVDGFPDGLRCVLAQFRAPESLDEVILNQHRIAKTDPWAANAQFVCALVNAYRTGQLVPREAVEGAVEAFTALLDAFATDFVPVEVENKARAALAALTERADDNG